MVNKTFKIGRERDNDFVFPNDTVSGHHAEITPLGNDRFRIEDKGSRNGTFVNNRRIMCCEVGYSDSIVLSPGPGSPGIIFDLKKYFPQQRAPLPPDIKGTGGNTPLPPDFSRKFLDLKLLYENYVNEKKRISKANNKKMMGIRIAASLGVGLLAFGIMFAFGDKIDSSTRMLVSPIMMAVTMGVSMLAVNSDDTQVKKLDEWFQENYVCPNPKCRQPLNGTWHQNRLRRNCPYCHAKWHE